MNNSREYPKVLVISHNPFSKVQNNGKTLSAFFRDWPKNKIAQLYLTLDNFDFSICTNFFRFSDLEVLKCFFCKKFNIGKEFNADIQIIDKDKEKAHKHKIYIFIRNLFLKRIPLLYCVRNLVWNSVKPWKKDNFKKWIKKFNPDIVFFQSSNVYAIFDMVEDICNENNIPMIMETTDDYVTGKFSIDPFFWLDHYNLLRKYKKAVENSKCVFAIGDIMAKEYTKRFGGNFKVAMNSIEIKEELVQYDKITNEKLILTYAGNLGLNRWKVLRKIGQALLIIKKEKGIDLIMEIYSLNTPSHSIIKKLTICDVMRFKGNLNSQELMKQRNNSDILVHVESFDKKNQYITRLSISTKIPEYLLSQRCIVAVGPKSIASIKYLRDNNIGKVITSLKRKNLVKELEEILQSRELRNQYIKNGKMIVNKHCSAKKNKDIVQKEIFKSVL